MNIPKYIIVHHEAPSIVSLGPRLLIVNDYHRQKGFPKSELKFYVGYHKFIEKNGEIITTRNDYEEGAHTKGYNLQSLGVCLAGNFDIELPTQSQIKSLRETLSNWRKEYKIKNKDIVPHRVFAQKSCYGSRLSDSWACNLLIEDQRIYILKALVEAYKKLLSLLKK